MSKCKHVEGFMNIPIIKLFEILKDDFICSNCGNKVTLDDVINEIKEIRE